MASRSNKELLTILLLVSVQIPQGFALQRWDKREDNLIEYDDNEMDTDGNQNIIPKLFKRIYPVINNLVQTKSRPLFETTTGHGKCSCKLKFQHLDLGWSYFPRQIPTGSCQNNSCKEDYECIEKKYVVVVLKRRDSKITEDRSSLSVPRTLRDFWTAENVSVTVACDCRRGFQMVYENNL